MPLGIQLHGKNNTWSAPVSQSQAEQARGVIHPMWRPEPLWKSALTVALLIVPFIVWSILA